MRCLEESQLSAALRNIDNLIISVVPSLVQSMTHSSGGDYGDNLLARPSYFEVMPGYYDVLRNLVVDELSLCPQLYNHPILQHEIIAALESSSSMKTDTALKVIKRLGHFDVEKTKAILLTLLRDGTNKVDNDVILKILIRVYLKSNIKSIELIIAEIFQFIHDSKAYSDIPSEKIEIAVYFYIGKVYPSVAYNYFLSLNESANNPKTKREH